MQQSDKEKKNERFGIAISVAAHVVVFLLFLFIVAWRAPNPPLPEIGIELNFGLDEAGSGEEQPEPFTTPSDADTEEEAAEGGMEETPEEVVEEQTEVEDPSEPVTDPVEAVDAPTDEVETPVTNTQDSPDVVKDTPVEPEVKKEEVKEAEEKQEEAPKLPPVLYPNNKAGAGGKNGDSNKAPNANNGDKDNAVGDQGDPKGTIDAKALYGKAGGGGGSSLEMTGWMWSSEPKPIDTSEDRGKIVFQVVIDDKGEIRSVKTIESNVSFTVKKIYEDAVWKLTFTKTSGSSVASSSTGTITFVMQGKKDN